MIKLKPKAIWSEYEAGQQYKSGIGDKGIYEQSKINERFFVGDQWHGVNAGNEKPLTRRNIIKRIGEYKMSTIGSSPITVNYSAEGIANTVDLSEVNQVKTQLSQGESISGNVTDAEITAVMSALTDYFKVTAERIKYDDKKDQLLKNAYISGTGILYTYWDSSIKTGLYADEGRTVPIMGDINCEILDVENVVFGDPNQESVEEQPYIIIAQRQDVEKVRRQAEKYGQAVDNIFPDGQGSYYRNAGDRGEDEPSDSRRVTVITKLYKKYDLDGNATVWGKTVTENAVVRPEWNLLIHRYPIAKFVWERRRNCAYGDSEITYQIPNQIALNQAHSISVWAMQNTGMPKTIINGDLIPDGISNDPAEVVKIYGNAEDMLNAIRYVAPPNYGAAFINYTNVFAQNILADSGATDVALGNFRPDNASAIVQAREAAVAPMQMYQNRFYSTHEDVARIWADFWVTMYGKRSIKINDAGSTRYIVFDADRYKDLVITAKIDVGASTLWSEAVSIANLGNLLSGNMISFIEYLERIPKGLIPNITGLINARKQQEQMQQSAKREKVASPQKPVNTDKISDEEIVEYLKQTNPEAYEKFVLMPPEDQKKLLMMIRKGN